MQSSPFAGEATVPSKKAVGPAGQAVARAVCKGDLRPKFERVCHTGDWRYSLRSLVWKYINEAMQVQVVSFFRYKGHI